MSDRESIGLPAALFLSSNVFWLFIFVRPLTVARSHNSGLPDLRICSTDQVTKNSIFCIQFIYMTYENIDAKTANSIPLKRFIVNSQY